MDFPLTQRQREIIRFYHLNPFIRRQTARSSFV